MLRIGFLVFLISFNTWGESTSTNKAHHYQKLDRVCRKVERKIKKKLSRLLQQSSDPDKMAASKKCNTKFIRFKKTPNKNRYQVFECKSHKQCQLATAFTKEKVFLERDLVPAERLMEGRHAVAERACRSEKENLCSKALAPFRHLPLKSVKVDFKTEVEAYDSDVFIPRDKVYIKGVYDLNISAAQLRKRLWVMYPKEEQKGFPGLIPIGWKYLKKGASKSLDLIATMRGKEKDREEYKKRIEQREKNEKLINTCLLRSIHKKVEARKRNIHFFHVSYDDKGGFKICATPHIRKLERALLYGSSEDSEDVIKNTENLITEGIDKAVKRNESTSIREGIAPALEELQETDQ